MINKLSHNEYVQRLKELWGDNEWQYEVCRQYTGMYQEMVVRHNCGMIRTAHAKAFLDNPMCGCTKKDRMVAPNTPKEYWCTECKMPFYTTPRRFVATGCPCCRATQDKIMFSLVEPAHQVRILLVRRTRTASFPSLSCGLGKRVVYVSSNKAMIESLYSWTRYTFGETPDRYFVEPGTKMNYNDDVWQLIADRWTYLKGLVG